MSSPAQRRRASRSPAVRGDRAERTIRSREDEKDPHRHHRKDAHRHDQPEQRKFGRSGQTVANFGDDRLPRGERLAEVALRQVADIVDELLRQRFVEAQILTHQRDRFGRRVGARGEPRRVARQQVNEHEHQQADDQQRRNQPQQTLGYELKHGVGRCRRSRECGNSASLPKVAGSPLARG